MALTWWQQWLSRGTSPSSLPHTNLRPFASHILHPSLSPFVCQALLPLISPFPPTLGPIRAMEGKHRRKAEGKSLWGHQPWWKEEEMTRGGRMMKGGGGGEEERSFLSDGNKLMRADRRSSTGGPLLWTKLNRNDPHTHAHRYAYKPTNGARAQICWHMGTLCKRPRGLVNTHTRRHTGFNKEVWRGEGFA